MHIFYFGTIEFQRKILKRQSADIRVPKSVLKCGAYFRKTLPYFSKTLVTVLKQLEGVRLKYFTKS